MELINFVKLHIYFSENSIVNENAVLIMIATSWNLWTSVNDWYILIASDLVLSESGI